MALREGETLAKGAIAAERLEVAAAGVTLSATTVMLDAIGAAIIIDAIKNSMSPKPCAVDKPSFDRPFAPNGGFDVNAPTLKHDYVEAKKWWSNRSDGSHVRVAEPEHRDELKPGHWASGRGGTAPHWVVEDRSPLKNAPFFATAPLDADGRPAYPCREACRPIPPTARAGPTSVSACRSSGRHPSHPFRRRRPPRPARPCLSMSSPSRPACRPASCRPECIATSRSATARGFGSPGIGAGSGFQPFPTHHAPAFNPATAHAVSPDVDLGSLDAALGKANETAAAALQALGTPVSLQITAASINAVIAKLIQAKSLLDGLGLAGGSGTTGSTGPRRVVAGRGGASRGSCRRSAWR